MVTGSGLDVPDVSGVATELAGLESSGDGVFVADSATSGVDEPSTLRNSNEHV